MNTYGQKLCLAVALAAVSLALDIGPALAKSQMQASPLPPPINPVPAAVRDHRGSAPTRPAPGISGKTVVRDHRTAAPGH
jgi:hypothetical protein